MFTGLVETIGTVSALKADDTSASGGGGTSLTISNAEIVLEDVHTGDSISVNGTCLTVTEFSKDTFKVGIAPETLRRTNLGQLNVNSKVNLERAVSGHTRMGGHFVQGHVDTIANIISVVPEGNALVFRFEPRDRNVLQYIIEKGYICIDGASLTVTAVNDSKGWWEVMLIAHTQQKIVTASKKPGEAVNIEVDMVGKYVEKCVVSHLEALGDGRSVVIERTIERIVEAKLKEAGLITKQQPR